MFNRPTLFVLGAGASSEAGLPEGVGCHCARHSHIPVGGSLPTLDRRRAEDELGNTVYSEVPAFMSCSTAG
jgi:hypothetical protein